MTFYNTNLAQWSFYFLGYFFAVIIGHFFIDIVVDKLWRLSGWKDKSDELTRPKNWQSGIVGVVERTLIVSAFLVGWPQFIALWFALRIGGSYRDWSEGRKDYAGHKKIEGPAIFNIFLIGTGLSLGYAFVGLKIIELLKNSNVFFAIFIPFILMVLTLLLRWWAEFRAKRRQGNK